MQKFCEYCGAQYEGRADSRFCSIKCKNAYHNQRRKSEIGDLDGSDEDEDEPVNDFDDDEDEPINGYEDDDTADEDTENDWDEAENEEEDEEEEEEDDDDEDYDNLLAAYEHEKNVSSTLLQHNAKLATSEGNLKRENSLLKQQLGNLKDRVERYQSEVGELHRELSETKDQLTKALTAKPKCKPAPIVELGDEPEDEPEEKDDFLSLICDYED